MKGQERTSAFSHLFQTVRRIEEQVLAWGILLIAATTIANVFCRSVLNHSLAFAEELSQFLIIFVTFVGLGDAAARGRHIRMSALTDQLGDRARKVVATSTAAATSLLMFLLTAYSIRYIATVASLGTVSPALRVPIWIVYCAAPVGLLLAGVQYALAVLRNLTAEGIYLSYDVRDEYSEPLAGEKP